MSAHIVLLELDRHQLIDPYRHLIFPIDGAWNFCKKIRLGTELPGRLGSNWRNEIFYTRWRESNAWIGMNGESISLHGITRRIFIVRENGGFHWYRWQLLIGNQSRRRLSMKNQSSRNSVWYIRLIKSELTFLFVLAYRGCTKFIQINDYD